MDASSKHHWNLEEGPAPSNTTYNPTFESVLAARLSRRRLLTGVTTGLGMFYVGSLQQPRAAGAQSTDGFVPVLGSTADKLITPPGYVSTVLVRWGDPLVVGASEFAPTTQTAAQQAQQFGYNCDFIGYLPLPQGSRSSSRGLLGVNHEFTLPMLMHPAWDGKPESVTQEMVDISMAAHGFSVVEIVRGSRGAWTYVRDSAFNRRLTAATPMATRGPAAGQPLLRTSTDPTGLAGRGAR